MKESAEFYLKPNGKGIETVRKKSDQFFKSIGITENTANEQIMILNELVKIGSAFGDFSPAGNKVRVQRNINEKNVQIEVSNPIKASALDRLKELDKTLQFIRGFQDPFEAFLKMKASMGSPHGNGANGLGLAKIAYEGNATVDFFVNGENILNLSAVSGLGDEYHK